MNKYEIAKLIEKTAPTETQEKWDCSGWITDNPDIIDVKHIMLALTITEDVVLQARKLHCDMIISHHPLFYVPLNYNDIQMYCAHTNLDKAEGGTTDTLIETLKLDVKFFETNEFLRYVELKEKITVKNLLTKIKKISNTARYINNKHKKYIKKIALCAGSGSEFIKNAEENNCDAFITGDIKYHTAIDSNIILFDIGHFESEKPVLKIIEKLIKNDKIKITYAKEKTPFINI